jgi:hypothetical protein
LHSALHSSCSALQSLDCHVTEIARGCSYHTRALRHIRPLINLPTARMVAQGVVISRLDCCNGILYGISARNVERLQVANNSLARAVCQATWSSSATELRRSLHWLPVKQRVDYKVAVIAFKTRSSGSHPTCRRSSRTMNQADHCARLIDFYCTHRVLNAYALEELSALKLRWRGTLYPSTVTRLSHCLLLNVFQKLIYLLLHTHRLYLVIVMPRL